MLTQEAIFKFLLSAICFGLTKVSVRAVLKINLVKTVGCAKTVTNVRDLSKN